MPTGSYTGNTSSVSDYIASVSTMLDRLPDNTQNLIDPKDLRDPIWTLWNRIDDLSASFSAATAATAFYNRTTPTPISVGGVTIGTTFSGTVQDALDKILYPYIAPACSLSGGNNREFGSSNAVTLSWSATKNSNPIISIIVNGIPIVPTGNSQSGVAGATATQDINTTFYMSVSDGTSTPTSNTTVTWLNKRYWGRHATFTLPTNMQILALSGAGVGTGNELSTTRLQTRNGIDGAGQYLVFAWPTSFGTPQFKVNGLFTTAWTKIGNAITFTNAFSYVNTYDVWISNTPQNSPLGTFEIL